MKKLLFVAPLFYPQKNGGGPTVSVMNIILSLKKDFDIYVLTNNYETGDTKPLDDVTSGWNEFDFGKVYYFNYGENTAEAIARVVDEVSPDVIYQNSFFSATYVLPILKYCKGRGVKLILAPRGELCPGALALKSAKKHAYIAYLKVMGLLRGVHFHTTGDEETRDVMSLLHIGEDRVSNIPNISVTENEGLIPIEKTPNSVRLIFAARIQKKKNLLLAIEALKDVTEDVIFDVYGPMESEEYWAECQRAIAQLPENVKVSYCGQLEQKLVSKTITEYHAFYMPTFSENYGHSIVESFLSYRPVIISDQTPWTELESFGCGYSIPLDRRSDFSRAVSELARMDAEAFEVACRRAREYIDRKINNDEVVDNYRKMFNG